MSINYLDADYDTVQERNTRPVRMSRRSSVARRPKASRSRGGSTGGGAGSPGGIRQRRNKRWAW